MKYVTTSYFASTYGSGSFGSNTYNGATTTNPGGSGTTGTTSGGSVSSSSGGALTNTGFDLALIASLACAIVFVALLVRFWKRPAKELVEDSKNQ